MRTTKSRKFQAQFSEWANAQDLCLDELFMSSGGVPENPFLDDVTHLAFDAWLAGRRSGAASDLLAEALAEMRDIRAMLGGIGQHLDDLLGLEETGKITARIDAILAKAD